MSIYTVVLEGTHYSNESALCLAVTSGEHTRRPRRNSQEPIVVNLEPVDATQQQANDAMHNTM